MINSFGVILGIDGSGKSTLIERLKLKGVNTTDWKELRNIEEVAYTAPERPGDQRLRLKPMSRAMFVAAHLVAEYEYLVAPVLSKGKHVLLDSYYFRWMAKEKIYNVTHPIFYAICEELPQPEFVIFLDVEPELAFCRKSKLSRFEYLNAPTIEDFSGFQSLVVKYMLDNIEPAKIYRVNANNDMDTVEKSVILHLNMLGWSIGD